jgi:hypothetical protein
LPIAFAAHLPLLPLELLVTWSVLAVNRDAALFLTTLYASVSPFVQKQSHPTHRTNPSCLCLLMVDSIKRYLEKSPERMLFGLCESVLF